MRRWVVLVAVIAWCCVTSVRAAAADETLPPATPRAPASAPEGSETPPPAPPDEDAVRLEAKAAFARGLELVALRDWSNALVQFQRSNDLFATKVASLNVAICLERLGRHQDAAQAFQEVEARHAAKLTPADRARIADSRAQILAHTGMLLVGSIPPGAEVSVDGKVVGTTPLELTLDEGLHALRLRRDGYEVDERPITVEARRKATVQIRLERPRPVGRLTVREKNGVTLDVYVDGANVGMTPWSGKLPAGRHTVALRGQSGQSEMDDLVAPSRFVEVRSGASSDVTLTVERRDALLTVSVQPASASIFVDGERMGTGNWEGPVVGGSRDLIVSAPGYVAVQRRLEVSSSEPTEVAIELQPYEELARVAEGPYVEAFGGLSFAPSLGSSTDAACDAGACAERDTAFGWGAGARGGYAIGAGVAVELAGAFGALDRSVVREQTALAAGELAVASRFRDEASLSGPLATLGVAYRALADTPITGRIFAGIWWADLETSGGGRFFLPSGAADYQSTEDDQGIWLPLLGAELRAGIGITSRLSVDLGVAALMAFPGDTERTCCDGKRRVATAESGGVDATLPRESGVGSFVVLSPTLGARWTF